MFYVQFKITFCHFVICHLKPQFLKIQAKIRATYHGNKWLLMKNKTLLSHIKWLLFTGVGVSLLQFLPNP